MSKVNRRDACCLIEPVVVEIKPLDVEIERFVEPLFVKIVMVVEDMEFVACRRMSGSTTSSTQTCVCANGPEIALLATTGSRSLLVDIQTTNRA